MIAAVDKLHPDAEGAGIIAETTARALLGKSIKESEKAGK